MAEDEKKFPKLLIVGLVVFGLLLAGGISYFIATKIASDKTTNQTNTQREPGVFVKIGDAKEGLVLNIGGVNSGRYLKVSMFIELKPDKKAAPKEGKMASPEEVKIQDAVVHALRAQRVEDFDPNKQEQLKEYIKSEVNKTLGEDRVYEVYITSFVLQ